MYYQWLGDDLVLECQIQPRAREDAFTGVGEDTVKIRITAAPVDGKANQHLIKFLSRQFRTPPSNIRIEKGQSGRRKRVRISAVRRLPPELNLSKRSQ
jgi:uncharacterized protein (TIGR00251 family)